MDTTILIEPQLDLPRLAQVLDEIGNEARVWSTRRWTAAMQAKLFEAAKGFRQLDLAHFVPGEKAPLEEVAHQGHNSLPMFSDFQKVFCKPAAAAGVLYGYNRQTMMRITGPGYYVARPGEVQGEVDIDYTMVPPETPQAWPIVVPNSGLVGRRVYGDMVDVMRGLSSHVAVGRAFKRGESMDAWFVLVRP